MNKKILVSACLLGKPVRYNGTGATSIHPILQKWLKEDRLISVCPEILAGMSVPRAPAEIKGEGTGMGVLNKTARVIDKNNQDVTTQFIQGAQKVLALVQEHQIKIAIMKARSPSCGSIQTYDGSFSSKLVKGQGVASALLMQNGCKVFNEEHLEDAEKYLSSLGGHDGKIT